MGSLGAGTGDPDEPFPSPRGCPPLPRDPRERGRGSQKEPPAAGLPEAEGRRAPQVAVPPPGTLPAARSPLPSRPPPRPTRRQEPGPERSAGLTSPPPRCRLPSVLLGPPPRPRREPAPGAEGAGPRACGPLIGPARGHSEAPPGLPHSWRSPAELGVGVGVERGRSAAESRARRVGYGEPDGRTDGRAVAALPGSEATLTPKDRLCVAERADVAGGQPGG